ncbi:ATP-dependent sacrificial sulfur transferase LarE [Desulfobacterota bacterium M19]
MAGGKYNALKDLLCSLRQVAVAFSGGVDSSFLLWAAHEVLGPEKVTAIFADSIVQLPEEGRRAVQTAKFIGVNLNIIKFDILALAEFRANGVERCYFCKRHIFSSFSESLKPDTILIDGTNLDDSRQIRPGARACRELGVRSPLLEAGITKKEIRSMSRERGLATWARHSASCLATRIAFDQPITAEDLTIVAKAENFLHKMGFMGCRLRLRGTTATIELAAGDISRLMEDNCRQQMADFCYSLGLKKVLLDLCEREGILF